MMITEIEQIIIGNKLNKRIKPNRDKTAPPILIMRGKVHLYNDTLHPFEKPKDDSYYIVHIRDYKDKTFNTYSIEEIIDISQIKHHIVSEKEVGDKIHISVNPNNHFDSDYTIIIDKDYKFSSNQI